MLVFMIPVERLNVSIDLDYFSLGKSEDNELCKEFQVVLGVTGKKRTRKKHIGKKRTGKKRICIYDEKMGKKHGKKAHSERSAHGKKRTRINPH